MKIKKYRKRKKGTFITLLILLSFIIAPILLFGNFGQAAIQEDDIFPTEGELIYLGIPYTYAGTFYDISDPTFAYSTASIEFVFDPTAFDPLTYDYNILTDFLKYESNQPYDETNFTINEGSYRDLNNLTANDDYYGSWNYTGIGEYRASYSFTDELTGTSGDDIDFVDTVTNPTSGSITIISNLDEHKKVLRFEDDDGANQIRGQHTIIAQTSGTIEYWFGIGDLDSWRWIIGDGGSTHAVVLGIAGGEFQYYDGAWNSFGAGIVPVVNTWYHIRIDFECGAGLYQGLAEDDFHLYWNGVQYADNDMRGTPTEIDVFQLYINTLAEVGISYIDAWGESWDNDYMIGWNREEYAFFGDYNSTYSFENDDIGDDPTGWVVDETGGTINVIGSKGGHKKVLEFLDDDAVNGVSATDTFSIQTDSTIEFWWAYSATETLQHFFRMYFKEGGTSVVILYLNYLWAQLGAIQLYYGGGYHETGAGAYPINTMRHIKLEFDDTANEVELTVNGVNYGSFPYNTNSAVGIDNIRCETRTTNANPPFTHWIDAVDYSWSPGYSNGRNRLTENHDLLGHYPASHSFPFDDVGEAPEGWTITNDVFVLNSWNEHRKVLQLNRVGANPIANYDFYTDITSGTVEFYFGSDDVTHLNQFRLRDGTSNRLNILFQNNKIEYYSGGYNDICAASDDTWYHIRIDFECGVGLYQGLAPDTFYVYVDGVQYGAYNFWNVGSYIDNMYLICNTGATYNFYVDAIDLSWDPDYYTGRNLNPTRTNLLGQYPGTYSFESELVYLNDEEISFVDVSDAAMSTVIESSLGNHRKILKLTATAGGSRYIKHDFADQTTDQTVEWWFRLPSVAASTYYNFYFYDSSNTLAIKMYVQDNDIYRMNGGLNKILDAGVIVDTWHHIKLSWDLTFDTVDTYFDGILIEDNGAFYNMVSNIAYVEFRGYHAASDVVIYMDALGVSWDDNNLIGDNLHYNNFLGSETFENYDWIYPGDYYGTESFDYYMEDEVYYGTYDFRDEEDGDEDSDIDGFSAPSSGKFEIVAEHDDHKKVLHYTDSLVAWSWYQYLVPDYQVSGTIEFYLDDITRVYWRLRGDGTEVVVSIEIQPAQCRVQYGDGLGGSPNTAWYVYTTAFPHFKVTWDCTTDKFSMWCEGNLLVDNLNFQSDFDLGSIRRWGFYHNGVSEFYFDAIGWTLDTTSHSGLGYTIGYNILDHDIEPLLEGGYEIDNIYYGDSLETVNILDSHMNIVNITGSSDTDMYFIGNLEAPHQWDDFTFTEGVGDTVGELETNNNVDYSIVNSGSLWGAEYLLGYIVPADSDILAEWDEGDAPPHWSLLDEAKGDMDGDGGNIRARGDVLLDKWNFDSLVIPAGGYVSKIVVYLYVKDQSDLQTTTLDYTTSETAIVNYDDLTTSYVWRSTTHSGLNIDQGELDAFWVQVKPEYTSGTGGFIDIETVYVDIYVTPLVYEHDWYVTWDVDDPNLSSIDYFRYDYMTTVAIDTDLDIYNWDTTGWLELQSNTDVNWHTSSYALTDPYIDDGTNRVRVRFQSATHTSSFDIEMDQLALDYTNSTFSFDTRSLSIYDTFSQGSGTIEFWTYFGDAPNVSRVLFNNDTHIFHDTSYYWRYDTTNVKIVDLGISQWVHFKIEWSGNDVDVYVNGTKKIDTFWSDGATTLTRIDFMSFNNYSFYVDAVGFSWDSDYDVGDNINSHGKAVITELENEGWDITVEPYTSFGISGDYGSHKKFLNITDNSAYTTWIIDQDFSPQTSGTVEFYYYVTTDQVLAFYLRDAGGSSAVRGYIRHGGNNFKVYDIGVLTTIKTPDANNAWHHIRIDFECGAGGYQGLSADTFDLYIDGVLEADGFGFNNGDLASITEIMFSSSDEYSVDVGLYLDAISYSWEEYISYFIGSYNQHCNIEAIIDFIVEIPFAEYERFILQILAESRHYTNIYTNMTFSIYNFTSSSWVEISNSRSIVETLYFHNEIDLVNGMSRLFNDYGYVRFRYYGYNNSAFYLNIDLLNTTIYFPQDFSYTHTLNLLGTWKYRFCLDVGEASEYNTTWVYFNVILPIDNFEAISESEYVTRWILTSNSTSPVLNFSDDLSGANWDLYGVSEDSFYAYLSDPYLFDNITFISYDYLGTSFGVGGEDTAPKGITWDGIFYWVVGDVNNMVYKYTSAGVYTGTSFNVGGQDTSPTGITWDGTHYWVVGDANNRVYQYTSVGVYTGTSFNVGGQDTSPWGVVWDGTYFWVSGAVSKEIYQYNAAGGYTTVHFDVGAQDALPTGIAWDGTYFWVSGDDNNRIYQYTSVGVYTGTNFGAQDTWVEDILWDGSDLQVVGHNGLKIFEFASRYDVSKNYHGGGYVYMQTNETETLSLRSTDYGVTYNLSTGDYFIIDFQTTSLNQINLILLKDEVQQGSYVVSQSGNTNFQRHIVDVVVSGDVEFDQIMFSGTFEDTKYFKCWDVKTYQYTLTGDSADFYVDPDGIKSIFLQEDTYVLRIFEEGLKKVEEVIILDYDGLTQYVYYTVGTIECRVVLFTADGVYLPFTNFHVNLTKTLNNDTNSDLMVDNIFEADIGSSYIIEVYDTFDSSVNILFDAGTGGVKTYIDLYLEVYLLKIKNEALEYVEYLLYNNDTASSITGNIFSEEIVEFNIISGTYILNYTNHEDNYPRSYNFSFTDNRLITINTTYHTVYFGLFTYDGLGLNRDWVRFYINGVRKDFGRNIIQSETAELIVLDYFNNTLANDIIDASAYSEYNIYVQVYSLYILNQFTYDDLIMNITQVGSGYYMTQLIPSSSALLYRFIPDVNYTIIATYVNGTVYSISTINLTDNSQTESFGVPSKPEEYPKDVYFGIYTTTGLGIDHDLVRFYIDGNRTDFGFNRITNEVVTIVVRDFFNTTLFNQMINTSGIYEYDILITLYSLKVKNEARVETNYTLSYGLLETTGFILPEEIIEYQLSSNNYVFDYTNNEDGSSHTINVNLNQDRVYILNSTYYTTYFSLYSQNGVRLDDSLFSLYLNGSRKDFGFVELASTDVLIVVQDYLNFTAFNNVITLSGSTEYNIIITVFELQIRHLAQENSNLTMFETTTHNHINFSMSPDSLNKFMLSDSIYNITWINGENGIATTYDITLNSDYILTLNTTYYTTYFSLFSQSRIRLDDSLFSLYINATRKDFGFVGLETDDNLILVQDYLNVTVFNQVVALRNFNEYNIIITVFELQIRHLGYENSKITLFETTAHNHINFSMAPDTLNKFMLANSTYNITWVNGENSVSTFYNITLNSDYILTLESSYFEVYFGLFTYDFLGIDRDFVRFYVNGDRKDFSEVLLTQDSNALLVMDYFNHTLYSATMNLRSYADGEWNIYVAIYTLNLFNNYTFPIDVIIERNNIEIRCSIPPQMFFEYRFVPNVEYEITWFYTNGTKIDDMELDFDENGFIQSFGFFEIEVPYDPEPLMFDTMTLIAFVVIISVISNIIVIAWAYMKGDRDKVPKKTRQMYKNKNKGWKPGTFRDDGI